MKKCIVCGEAKELTEFYKAKQNKDGLLNRCKSCHSVIMKEWVSKNKESHKKNMAEWYVANKGKVNETSKSWRNENLDKFKQNSKEWKQANKDKVCQYTMKRKALQLKASPEWDKELNDLVTSEAYSLAIRRKECTGITWNVDHYYPLKSKKVCGLHYWTNLQVIPATENFRKSNLMPEEFYA
jgi:hypothetical protein